MIPPDTYAVFELLPPKGDALVTYLESTQLWERCLCLRCLISPIGGTGMKLGALTWAPPTPSRYLGCSIPPWQPSPMSLTPSPIIRPHSSSSSYSRPTDLCSFLTPFPSTLLHLPWSACLRSSLPAFLQHMPALLGHQLYSEDFI